MLAHLRHQVAAVQHPDAGPRPLGSATTQRLPAPAAPETAHGVARRTVCGRSVGAAADRAHQLVSAPWLP